MKQESTPSELPLSVSQPGADGALPQDKLERRRMMIRTISGSATLLAAASPLKALASTTSCSTNKCSLSGMQSANHSLRPGETVHQCGGRSCNWWGKTWSNIPSCKPTNNWPIDHTCHVGTVLLHCSRDISSISCFELMGNSKYSGRDEQHWLCAYLNAKAYEQGFGPAGCEYPYTSTQILNFCHGIGVGSYTSADYLNFCKTYMEQEG